MSKFLEILKTQQVPNSVAPFHGNTPFNVQVNFDTPNFEGKFDVDAVDHWLSKLEWYFSVNNFLDVEKITFSLLKSENHIKLAWEMRVLNKESEAWEVSKIISNNKPTWGEFVGYIKEAYFPEDIYE